MKKFKSIITSILGDMEQVDSERYFMTMTCFVAAIFLLLLCAFHLIENLKLVPVLLAGGSSIVLFVFYGLIRHGTCLFYPKLIVTMLGLVMLDLTWYSKFLSNGPVLFFILVFGALVIWVWEGKPLIIMLSLYFLNLAFLYLIEYNAPATLFHYPSSAIRSSDIYISFLLYTTLMVSLLLTAKTQFKSQKDKAVESDKIKSAFLANMSHEIRTPMNHIVGFSGLLENENDNSKRLQYLKIVQHSGASLLKLINDLIDLSKIEAGDLTIQNSNFSINELFVELKEIYSQELIQREKNRYPT